jgi:hypothetical protein
VAGRQSLRITQFQADLKKFAAQVQQDLVEVTVDTAVAVAGAVVGDTPRDTGTARANWNFSIGAPDLSVKPKRTYDEYAKPVSSEEASVVAKSRAEEVFGVLRGQGTGRLEPLYVSNALSYIWLLNDGTSQQAPEGFVEIAVQKVEVEVVEKLIASRVK